MSIIITNKFLLTWHILFQAFVKYHLHSKHLNKILFEIVNFGVLQHFSEAIKNTSSSTKKKKKNAQVLKQLLLHYTKFSHIQTLNKK